MRPMGTAAYGGKGQGKGKGRGEGRLGQGGRGRSKGGEKPMGTTTYGGKGSKGRAANGDRPVGAASCKRPFSSKFPRSVHPLASATQTPYPLLHAFAARTGVVGCAWVHGGVGCSGRRGVGHLPSLAAHFVARLPGPPQHRSELLLG